MVVWSSCVRAGIASSPIRSLISSQKQLANHAKGLNLIQVRNGGHGPEKFYITPSRYQWHRFKDLFHLYFFVGLIPMTALLFYVNVFIGPAQLAPIPEGYEPKHWEYYSHPFQRFISRYIDGNPQQEYEKMLHFIFEEDEVTMARKTERKVKELIKERLDYQAWYYRPVPSKYVYSKRKDMDAVPFHAGD